jgi:hypothetical protein
MTDSLKISPEIDLMEISGSISDPRQPKTRKKTSERNHNPVSRYFGLLAKGYPTRKTAIDAMCAHCMGCTAKEQGFCDGDHIEDGFREQIRSCSSLGCPLRAFRPFQ